MQIGFPSSFVTPNMLISESTEEAICCGDDEALSEKESLLPHELTTGKSVRIAKAIARQVLARGQENKPVWLLMALHC